MKAEVTGSSGETREIPPHVTLQLLGPKILNISLGIVTFMYFPKLEIHIRNQLECKWPNSFPIRRNQFHQGAFLPSAQNSLVQRVEAKQAILNQKNSLLQLPSGVSGAGKGAPTVYGLE